MTDPLRYLYRTYDGAFAALAFIRQSKGEIDRALAKDDLDGAYRARRLMDFWVGQVHFRRARARAFRCSVWR